MSKRARDGASRKDRVVLDVGGTHFTSSVSTLTASSTYFEALFSRWDDGDEQPEVFIDRDPDAFRVLLSCMRQNRALLPDGNRDLFVRVLLDARFFGLDWLETAVKVKVMDHAWPIERHNLLKAYNSEHSDGPFGVYWESGPDAKVWMFEGRHGSIDDCLEIGLLPEQFFRQRPLKTYDDVQIKQLIACPKDDTVVFFDEEHEDEGRECRKALCLALVEDGTGRQHIEPVVRGRGIVMPEPVIGAWLTTEAEQQLVIASKYAGRNDDDGMPNSWAYAYEGEVDEHLGLTEHWVR